MALCPHIKTRSSRDLTKTYFPPPKGLPPHVVSLSYYIPSYHGVKMGRKRIRVLFFSGPGELKYPDISEAS